MHGRFWLLAAALTLIVTTPVAQPSISSYQGFLEVNGVPFDGSAQFKFAIVDGGQTLWSNDGTSSNGQEPTGSVTLNVSGGVFSALLGDNSGGFLPLAAVHFFGAVDPELIVWVDTGGGFEQLPSQRFASAPYALQSDAALRSLEAFTVNGELVIGTQIRFPDNSLQLTAAGGGPWTQVVNDIYSNVSGNVGIGNTTPATKLDVGGVVNSFALSGTDPNTNVTFFLTSLTQFGGSDLELRRGDESVSFKLTAYNSRMRIDDGSGMESVRLDGDGHTAHVYDATGVEAVRLDGTTHEVKLFDALGSQTVTITGADGGGNGRVTTEVLEITGGADLAEHFDVTPSSDEAIEAGVVVCIDPNRPGDLIVSHEAYQTTVAGIVSGAGGVRSGMIMGQRGSVADGGTPVALVGRVWTWCDTEGGAIEPGDLLTTSDTAGHAMKVGNHRRARGAIIGKAMTPLESGRGLVLVLVSLQ